MQYFKVFQFQVLDFLTLIPATIVESPRDVPYGDILYVPPISQQIQISVDQPYAGPSASCCGINGTHSIFARMYVISAHYIAGQYSGQRVHMVHLSAIRQ
jgi:hypothetical protein